MNTRPASRKGAFLVPVYDTSSSPATPVKIATTLLKVVCLPKMVAVDKPVASSPRWWYSVIIQVSNALYKSVVLIPPKIRPTYKTMRLSDSMVKQQAR